ncbi:MAG TPA: class I lanthipeptide [Chitinophaga sp.]|uniref:class I lanthipeptide n=1 Tax=Chitinophaga sp. TaxID=1869181 RepID=UPI002C526CA6|nr:class I lanthipeptide [Chitinophaga sp.]HVI45115.1 class I lanthipeptide [Chitinophaga sp.]
MKKLGKKLSINKDMISAMADQEMGAVNGGLLSIGHDCSIRNECSRLRTTHWGNGCPSTIRTPHWSHEGSCSPE